MARVITGDYCQGHRGLRQAPYKPGPEHSHYDSVVDDVNNPTMYGVFNDASVWPEYIVEYSVALSQSSAPSPNQSLTSSRSQSPTPTPSQATAVSSKQKVIAGTSQPIRFSDK